MQNISYAKTVYGEEEIEAVVKCLRESTQMGNYSRKFEAKISDLFDKKETLYVNSGSSALFIGIEAMNFPEGSEVITPSLTFGTTVGCLLKNDLVPVFLDVKPLTYCIDESLIEGAITDKTVAILAPNLMGNVCNWPYIREIANKNNLIVIEDSADTLGATINGKKSGSFSDMSITSFYGSHIINCAGNGGSLSLNDETVIERSKLLRSWGRSSSLFDEKSEAIENRFNINLDGIDYDAKFVFETSGYNLEGSEIGAAFGMVQLEKLNQNILTRQKNFKKQSAFFKNFPDIFSNPLEESDIHTAWLAFPVLINQNAPFERKDLQIYLEERNIQTRVVFTGNIMRQPMMKDANFRKPLDNYPNSDAVMERGVLLPVHHGMTDEMFNRLHETIHEFVANF